jgi:hypothetical protein
MPLARGRLYPCRMKRTVSLFVSTLFFVFLFFRTTEAHALGPINIEAGALAGYATNPNGDNPYNTLGVGVGARAGVEFLGIYGGLRGMYYFGGSADVPGGSISSHAFMYGIDGGYSFHFLMLTIRPQIGIGNLTLSGSGTATGSSSSSVSDSDSHLYLQPGVTGLLTFGVVYVGAEVNVLIIPGVDQGDGNSKTYASLAINGEVGVRF